MRKQFWALAFFCVAGANALSGQVSEVRAGSFEVGGFTGLSFGTLGTRVMGGGNVTYGFSKILLGYAEYSYFPGIGETGSTGTASGSGVQYTYHYTPRASDYNAGVHVRLPIFREKPIVPYLVAGIGGITHYAAVETFTVPGVAIGAGVIPEGTDVAFNGGGGVRWYMGQRFGVRVEAKVYKSTGLANTFGKVEVGFFYQTH